MPRWILSAALVALLLAAAPLYADDAEDAAVKAVEKLGGKATRDEGDPAHPVVAVNLAGVPVGDGDLKSVAALTRLKTLDLSVCLAVTDAGLKHLTGLKRLEVLNLGYSGVTDAGVKRLAALTELRTLNLAGDSVTDEGLNALAGMTKLRSLILTRTQVTDKGVAELQKALPDCKIDR
jgi:internalin A